MVFSFNAVSSQPNIFAKPCQAIQSSRTFRSFIAGKIEFAAGVADSAAVR
jgi:hypothetical protein